MTVGDFLFPPALVLLGGAIFVGLFPYKLRSSFTLIVCLFALAVTLLLPEGRYATFTLMKYKLLLLSVDKLSKLFGIIFSLITTLGCVFSFHVKETGENRAALLYGAGALGVTFAGDYLTLFFFWELMALSSTFLIWAVRTEESEKAGMRYLIMHLVGGGLLLTGIIYTFLSTGSMAITKFTTTDNLSAWLILLGVGVNAAFIPLHAWLPDSYPKATVTGAVFLSALTTKAAVYVLLRVFAGWEILIYMGVVMALYGVFYAVLANDIREILAYHIISQVGYMVAGAGIGTDLAINGAAAHAFSHILYKALLFMGAGAVIQATGKSKLTELGGLIKNQRAIFILYMVGAFSISGFPLFNGFISKSIVVAAAGAAHHSTVELLLYLAAVGTLLHTALKLPYYTWYGENKAPRSLPIPNNMYVAMALTAFLCLFYGIFPNTLYQLLPYPLNFRPYTAYHLTETAQLTIFTFVAFWLFRKFVAGEAGITLDTDWFYRYPAPWLKKLFLTDLERLFNAADERINDGVKLLAKFGENPLTWGKEYNPHLYRPPLGLSIILVILCFIVLALGGFFLV